ncbi:MAG: hypothetical protein L6R41_006651 [Letrouitia leprolyta]|nr:MAG: hypothetical protein L6R41_006651 [Letrouitia leprolyta]
MPLLPRNQKSDDNPGSIPAGFIVLVVFAIALLVLGPSLAASYVNRRQKASLPLHSRHQVYEKLSKVTLLTPATTRNTNHDGKASEEDFELSPTEITCPFCLGALQLSEHGRLASLPDAPQDPAQNKTLTIDKEKSPPMPTKGKFSRFIWRFLFSKLATRHSNATKRHVESEHDTLTLKICGHSFHSSCLVDWVLRGKNDCPICRAKIFSQDAK